jgi:hypothetical protein
MDISWITDRIAVGGGIWTPEKMAEVARIGITHIIDMQIEFDDTPLAEPHGIQVLWNLRCRLWMTKKQNYISTAPPEYIALR